MLTFFHMPICILQFFYWPLQEAFVLYITVQLIT